MSARYFASHDGAVANGSVTILRSSREFGRYVAVYMNGDFIRDEPVPSRAAFAAKPAEFIAAGLVEYSWKDFRRLAPRCLGGRGPA